MEWNEKLCLIAGLFFGNWFCHWLLSPLVSGKAVNAHSCFKGLAIGTIAAILCSLLLLSL